MEIEQMESNSEEIATAVQGFKGHSIKDVESYTDVPDDLDGTLWLLDRVIAAAVTSIIVTDPSLPDNPIIYHNPAFEQLTGYAAYEINGKNCRFLQGAETDPATIAHLRDSIAAGEPSSVTILNYRKNGTPFWNELNVSPVSDAEGNITHFVGVQSDVTRRQEAEVERNTLLAQQQRIADTLQRALLLTPPDTFHGLEVSTQYLPAMSEAQFGGDFFDVFALDENRVALVVGDVTGKGLTAAQYTAEVKYALHVLLREYNNQVPALTRLNRFLMEAVRLDDRDKYALVCVALAIVDTVTGEATLTAAGMEPPMIVHSDGSVEEIAVKGMLLGMSSEATYDAVKVVLGKDDILLMATDGITEARNDKKEFFGYEGLKLAASEERNVPTLQTMGQRIVAQCTAYMENEQVDDICLMLIRCSNSNFSPKEMVRQI